MLIKNITEAIGNTPILEIPSSLTGLKNIDVYAKLELLNPFGSVKDRTAWYMLKKVLNELRDKPRTVWASTSGNTGKAMHLLLSMLLGIPLNIVTSRIHVPAIESLLLLLGAKVLKLPGASSCPDPSDPHNPFSHIERQVAAVGVDAAIHLDQYSDEENFRAHYETTGPEIYADVGVINHLVVGLGTSGSSRGIGQFLREKNPSMELIGVIATKGQFNPGVRNGDEMAEVGLFQKDLYNHIVEVNQREAIEAMLVLHRQLGVLAGPTSGASFAAALWYLKSIDNTLTTRQKACFLVADRVEQYVEFIRTACPDLFGTAVSIESAAAIGQQEEEAVVITVEQAAQWLTDESLLVIDTRGPLSYKTGHMPRSINLQESVVEEMSRQRGLPFAQSQRVLFVCPVGNQSLKFAGRFKARGLDCASLAGGYTAWLDAGGQIERPRPI